MIKIVDELERSLKNSSLWGIILQFLPKSQNPPREIKCSIHLFGRLGGVGHVEAEILPKGVPLQDHSDDLRGPEVYWRVQLAL